MFDKNFLITEEHVHLRKVELVRIHQTNPLKIDKRGGLHGGPVFEFQGLCEDLQQVIQYDFFVWTMVIFCEIFLTCNTLHCITNFVLDLGCIFIIL